MVEYVGHFVALIDSRWGVRGVIYLNFSFPYHTAVQPMVKLQFQDGGEFLAPESFCMKSE